MSRFTLETGGENIERNKYLKNKYNSMIINNKKLYRESLHVIELHNILQDLRYLENTRYRGCSVQSDLYPIDLKNLRPLGGEITHVSDYLRHIFIGAGCEAEQIPGYCHFSLSHLDLMYRSCRSAQFLPDPLGSQLSAIGVPVFTERNFRQSLRR